jgi:hypothetical protein
VIVESHNGLHDPLKVPATRVLVTGDDGTPICLVVEYSKLPHPWVRVFRVGDKDFNEQLHHHGINKTVTVTKMAGQGLHLPG